MRLWTVQPYCVYETLQSDGIFRCIPELSSNLIYKDFINAYDWLSKEMKERIGNPPEGVKYPIWAWFRVEGENKKPDMRKTEYKVSEKSVILEMEIPDTDVLLTDHTMWHSVLNDFLNFKVNYVEGISDEEWDLLSEKELEYYYSLSVEEQRLYKENSWKRVICFPTDNYKFIQATFWEIKKSQIKKVWVLKG